MRIRVRNSLDLGYSDLALDILLAEARTYYAFPQPLPGVGGILDNMIWKTINSGQDAYVDVANMVLPNNLYGSQFYYHGQIAVNFRDEDNSSATFNTNPVHWHLGLNTSPSFTNHDLYSLLLHELIHALGFASQINGTGNSGFVVAPYFTRYDTFLQKPQTTGPALPLLYDATEDCSMYTSVWNSAIPIGVLSPLCDGAHEFTTDCSTAIQFGGTLNQAIYNPGCYAQGSSLSHMADECDSEVVPEFEHYLMARGFQSGVMRRFLQDEERTILCNLGYQINDRFGFLDDGVTDDGVIANNIIYPSGVCTSKHVIGFNDGLNDQGVFTIISDNGLPVIIPSILSNDFSTDIENLTFECLELIGGNGTVSIDGIENQTSGDATSVIQFTPASNSGSLFIFRYIPVIGLTKGNITYVFVQKSNTPSTFFLYGREECLINNCNLISNGDFETDSEDCSHFLRPSNTLTMTCWEIYGKPILPGTYFSRATDVLDTLGIAFSCYGTGTSSNSLITPANSSPQAGIGSNTRSEPATETYNNFNNNNGGLIFIGAHKVDRLILTGPSSSQMHQFINTSRFRSLLSAPLVPGNSYILSYYAKAFKSNLDPNLTDQMYPTFNNLYGMGNVPAKLRFLIDNAVDFDETNNALLEVNTSLFPGTVVLAEPTPIEPVGPSPTATSDWHYREVIVQIPETIGNDYQYLTIDYNIWDSPYDSLITGVFIDDVSLKPYFGHVVALPEVICTEGSINNLSSYITSPGFTGTFSCPTCPPGSIGIDGNSFHAAIAGEGEYQIVFTYTNANGCPVEDVNTVLVDDAGCCAMDITVDQVVDNPCPESELGKAFITINNAPANVNISWTGPTTSSEEDPENLAVGTYVVTASYGSECSVSETVVVGAIAAVNIPPITSQALADQYLNNQVVHVSGSIIVSGPITTWEIHDCQLYFDINGEMRVNEDCSVQLAHVLMDACGASWKGINLISNHNTTNSLGGTIKNADALVVKHAVCGITCVDISSAGLFSSLECGSMSISNSSFIDNKTAIIVRSGNAANYTKYINIDNCLFQWTDDAVNHFPTIWNVPGPPMISFGRYKGAKLTDCIFENLTAVDDWSKRGTGVLTFDSKLSISSSSISSPLSTIVGFRMGIDFNGGQPYYQGSNINDVILEKNLVAIDNWKHPRVKIDRNTIHVGLPTGINQLDNALVKYEGISLSICSGFEVSENHIFGYIDAEGKLTDDDLPYTAGIVAKNNTSSNDEIYKNDLHNLNWAQIANGDNNTSNVNGGLRYVCNTNTGNNYDFLVADAPGFTGSQVGPVQTDYPNIGETGLGERAAGNTFTPNNTNAFNDFWNETQAGGIVYRYFLGVNQVPLAYNNLFLPQAFLNSNGCASELTLNVSGNIINQNNLTSWQTHRNSSRSEWLNTRYLWKSLIDNGNTEELTDQVENAYSSNTWIERQKLLDISPFVSDSVLYAVANNTTVFPHPVAMDIFLANPNVLSDKTFIKYLEEKSDPMPEYMIDILKDAGNQTTARTILENEMRSQQSIYMDAAQKIMRARTDDSTYTFLDQLEELKQWRNLPTEYELIEYYMEMGDYQTALDRYENIPAICDLSKNAKADYELYYSWLNLRRAIHDDNAHMDSLPRAFVAELQLLAEDNPYSYAGNSAMIVLNEYCGGAYYNVAYAPMEAAIEKSIRRKVKAVELQLMQVYPVPTNNLLNIKLDLPSEPKQKCIITIADATGKLMQNIVVSNPDQFFTLDLTQWKAGMYQVSLFTDGRLIQSKKFNVVD